MCAYFALNVLLNLEYSHIYGTGVFSAIHPIRYVTHHALRTLYLHHNCQEQETFSCMGRTRTSYPYQQWHKHGGLRIKQRGKGGVRCKLK